VYIAHLGINEDDLHNEKASKKNTSNEFVPRNKSNYKISNEMGEISKP
jgi:hypothetical protein